MLKKAIVTLNHALRQQARQNFSHCVLCHQRQVSQHQLCQDCWAFLQPSPQPRCTCCALPLGQTGLCGTCQQQPAHFDNIYCAFDYTWPIDVLLKRFKYARKLYFAQALQALLLEHINAPLPDAFTYVPLHWRKFLWRGFNQSEMLARPLATHYQRPLLALIKRRDYGKSQAQLNAKQRAKALSRSFHIPTNTLPAHICIVDDVVTTASTANVLAKRLKAAGAKRVDIWALARTPSPHQVKAVQ